MDEHLRPLTLTEAEIEKRSLVVLANQYGRGTAIQLNWKEFGTFLPKNADQARAYLTQAIQDPDLFHTHKLVAIHVVGGSNHKCIAIHRDRQEAWLRAVTEGWERHRRSQIRPTRSDGFSREDRYGSHCTWSREGHRLGGKGRVRGFIG